MLPPFIIAAAAAARTDEWAAIERDNVVRALAAAAFCAPAHML